MGDRALVLIGWGLGVLMATKLELDVSSADGYLIGVGAAAVIGGVLVRNGFAIDLVGVGATTLAAGVLHTLAGDQVPALAEPWPYVVLLAVVAAVNLALALAVRSSARGTGTPTGARLGRPTTTESSPTS